MRFGEFYAVRNVDVHIQAGEFFSFLGPSGCGKTTLLRLVSGFIEPTEGEIRIGGEKTRGMGPNRRPTAMIFQNLALFPLMTVAENIGFGLEVRGISKKTRLKKADQLLELVDLPGVGDKRVRDLSGGQMQRVAIARALAVEPAVLLLDEPLSALDLKLRKHMRHELRNIQRRTDVTFIYITHDQTEALTMSDRVGVMSVGRLEQVALPEDIYNSPQTAFVAAFVGENNRFNGVVGNVNSDHALLETALGPIPCKNPQGLLPGAEATIFIRPETVLLAERTDAEHALPCSIENQSFEGAYSFVKLKTPSGDKITMRLNNDSTTPRLRIDARVEVTFGRGNAFMPTTEEIFNA